MNTERIFNTLLEEYSLSKNEIHRLKTELEITKLKLEFALEQCEKDNISIFESIEKYTAFQRYTQKMDKGYKQKLIDQIKLMNQSKFDDLALLLFENSDYVKEICTHQRRSKCFSYDIYPQNEGVLIHFANAIVPANPFSETEIPRRKQELKDIAIDTIDNHNLKYVFSVSWMWNLRKFQSLMPISFNQSLKEFFPESYSMGHWGQFYRYDGSVNRERISEFRKNWNFPLKLLIGECSIDEFRQFYCE